MPFYIQSSRLPSTVRKLSLWHRGTSIHAARHVSVFALITVPNNLQNLSSPMSRLQLAIAAIATTAILLVGMILALDLPGPLQAVPGQSPTTTASNGERAATRASIPAPTVVVKGIAAATPPESGPSAKPAAPLALAATYSASAPKSWALGQTRSYEITVVNAGTETWDSEGPDPVRLGIHFGREDDTPHEQWSSDQRFNLPRSLAPGEETTLKVDVVAPSSPGNYLLRHRMVKEGVAWFGQTLKTEAMVSGSDRVASVVAIDPSIANSWRGGETRIASAISIKNEGTESWNARGPNPVKLAIHFGKESDFPHADWATDQRFDLTQDVPPGGIAVLRNVSITAPIAPGAYTLRLRMVKDEVSWFYQIHRIAVTVTGTPRSASYTSPILSNEPWVVLEARNASTTVTNDGTEAWNAGGQHPVRLGVHFGQDGDLPHDDWGTDQRFSLPEGDVLPGGSVTFTNLRVTAPTRPGSYVLRFRMVKEGAGWFDQLYKAQVVVRP